MILDRGSDDGIKDIEFLVVNFLRNEWDAAH
jgi:hypothetical protein